MQGPQEITAAMMRVIAPRGIPLTDPDQVSENLNSLLGEFHIDPEAAFSVAQFMMMAAAQTGESPEDTVVQSFVIGIAVGCLLGQGAGNA